MAAAGSNYARLGELQAELDDVSGAKDELELAWLEAAERID
jgi:hypothetical protein